MNANPIRPFAVFAALTVFAHAEARPNVRHFEDGVAWRAAQPTNIRIKAGSALDLSSNGRPEPAGTFGRLVVGKDGHFEFEKMPGVPQRLFGYGMDWCSIKWIIRDGKGGRLPNWRENLDAYAGQVRRHGYNFVRPHGLFDLMELDDWSTTGTFTEERLDELDCFCAALARRGVYLYIDICAYGMRFGEKPPPNLTMKAGVMNGEAKYVEAWKRCAKAILERKNAYTGVAYKDDPAIACIMQYNEQATGAKLVAAAELRKKGRTLTPETHKALAAKFLTTARMFNAETDKLGFRGLNSNYNSDVDLGACVARWQASDVVSYNFHFGHPVYPPGGGRRGQRVAQMSSIDGTARGIDFCCGVRLRFPDRPYVCSEYSQAYFNVRRYESGVLLPAYARLNGFDGILWHANAVELENTAPWPRGRLEAFMMFPSPVTRAASFVASCLFLRGDVSESPQQAIVDYPGDSWKDITFYAPNSSQAKIGLVMKTGVSFSGLPRPKAVRGPVRGDVTLTPAQGDVVRDGTWVSTVGGVGMESFSLDAFVADMKAKGVLPTTNRTDDRKRIYESVTGEILMDAAERRMTVTTPKTEAAALKDGLETRLDVMTVTSSVRALAALTSRDGRSLGKSRRMVFVYATQESNDGFEATPDETEVVEYGHGPVILRTGRISVSIRLERPEGLRLYLLDYDGTRLEEIPAAVRAGRLIFELDTSKTVHTPTPFFEIAEGCD